MKAAARWLWALALAGCGACLAQTVDVVDLPTRAGVTVRVAVLQPDKPTAVAVLLTGGDGRVGVYPNGSVQREGNFLVRSRGLFVQQGLATMVVDTPSDRSVTPFLGGTFRESPEHAADLAAIVRFARERFGKPVWLVGTSRGTHSAALGALAPKEAAPDGIVLTSSILTNGNSRGTSRARAVPEMGLKDLKMPVLVVHHRSDECEFCSPALLPGLMAALPADARLITYEGGSTRGPVCDPFAYHGFNGIEARVVADIAAWMAAPPAAR